MRRSLASLPSLAALLSLAALAACAPAPAPADAIVVHVPGQEAPPALVETAPSAAPEQPAPAGDIPWETSSSIAFQRAMDRGAPVLVFVFTDWATPAVQMDRLTWRDPRVVRAARSFIPLRLDVSKADATAQADADRHDIGRIPAVLILDQQGIEITRVEGHAGPDEVLSAMARAIPGN